MTGAILIETSALTKSPAGAKGESLYLFVDNCRSFFFKFAWFNRNDPVMSIFICLCKLIARNAHKTGVMSQKTTGTEERHRNEASPR